MLRQFRILVPSQQLHIIRPVWVQEDTVFQGILKTIRQSLCTAAQAPAGKEALGWRSCEALVQKLTHGGGEQKEGAVQIGAEGPVFSNLLPKAIKCTDWHLRN